MPKRKQGLLGGSINCAPSNFKALRGLDDTTVLRLLTKCADKEVPLQTLNTECKKIKALQHLRSEFVKETGLKTWEEATHQFPQHASDEKLEQFTSLIGNRSTARLKNHHSQEVCACTWNVHNNCIHATHVSLDSFFRTLPQVVCAATIAGQQQTDGSKKVKHPHWQSRG
jgi:hypothetical protein